MEKTNKGNESGLSFIEYNEVIVMHASKIKQDLFNMVKDDIRTIRYDDIVEMSYKDVRHAVELTDNIDEKDAIRICIRAIFRIFLHDIKNEISEK